MKLQKGDILAYNAKDWIARLSAGKYNHLAGISKIKGNAVNIIESHMATDGVVEVRLDKELYPLIDVYRVDGGLSDDEKRTLISGVRTNFVDKIPYDLPSFFSKFMRSTLGFMMRGTGWRKSEPLFNNREAFDCAETWTTAYYRFLGIMIIPEVHTASATPSDIGRTKGIKFAGKLIDMI